MTTRDPAPRWLRQGLALSLVLHVALVALARLTLAPTTTQLEGEPTAVDIEVAPAAPEAEKLPDEVPVPPPPPPPKPAEPVKEPEPEPVMEPEKEKEATLVLDAGVEDAEAVALGDAGDGDAGDGDGGLLAAGDAGIDDGDGGALALGDAGDGDAGLLAMAGDGGVGDGGIAEGGDGGTGEGATAGLGGGAVSAGTAADLLTYFPDGHVVSVLLRFDRLRGTEWAKAAEKVMAPMPDYQSLVGARDVRVIDRFESFVISSFDARRVDASTLVARTSMAPRELRRFVDEGAPVTWSVAQGGMLGERRPSPRMFPGDRRVFLSPFPGWLVLAQPADLGGLTAPAAGSLDTAQALPEALPPWLQRVRTIEDEAGAGEGPAVVVTVGSVGRRYKLPDLGFGIASVPAPERISMTLTVEPHGFVVRGNLRFASEDAATEFVTSAEVVQTRAVDSFLYAGMLKKGRVLNAVKNLSLVRTGRRVAYATSVSTADARALMKFAARTVSDWYGRERPGATPEAPRPAPPKADAPKVDAPNAAAPTPPSKTAP